MDALGLDQRSRRPKLSPLCVILERSRQEQIFDGRILPSFSCQAIYSVLHVPIKAHRVVTLKGLLSRRAERDPLFMEQNQPPTLLIYPGAEEDASVRQILAMLAKHPKTRMHSHEFRRLYQDMGLHMIQLRRR